MINLFDCIEGQGNKKIDRNTERSKSKENQQSNYHPGKEPSYQKYRTINENTMDKGKLPVYKENEAKGFYDREKHMSKDRKIQGRYNPPQPQFGESPGNLLYEERIRETHKKNYPHLVDMGRPKETINQISQLENEKTIPSYDDIDGRAYLMGGQDPKEYEKSKQTNHGMEYLDNKHYDPYSKNNHNVPQQNSSNEIPTGGNNWYNLSSYSFYEIIMYVFLLSFVYNWIFGKAENDKYSDAWYNANKQYFEERYEIVGIGKLEPEEAEKIVGTQKNEKPKTDNPMVKENPFVFKLYVQKYKNVKWAVSQLEFHKRSDIITSLILNEKDRLTYEVALNLEENVNWMFCICKRKDVKNIEKSCLDINFFTKVYEPPFISNRLSVLSESEELLLEIFKNKNLLTFFKTIEEHIYFIFYSDQNSFSKEKAAIFFSFEIHLNKANHETRFLEITHFVNLLANSISQLKYTKEQETEFAKRRVLFEKSKIEENKRREDELQEKQNFIEQWKLKNKLKNKKIAKAEKKVKLEN